MIVNTAYIYMGRGGGTPVNPNLWQDGVSNYPAALNKSTITTDGLVFTSAAGTAIFSDLPLTHFNGLKLSGRTAGATISAKVTVEIEFYDSNDTLLGNANATFSKSGGSVSLNIPTSAKVSNAKIKIAKNYTSGITLTLISAMLS